MKKVAETYPNDPVDPMRHVMAEGGPFHAQRTGHGQPRDWGAYLQRLRNTGRGHHAERLVEKYGA